MPDRVTCVLIYLAIGSLIWCFLKVVGAVDRATNNCARRGLRLSTWEVVGSSLLSILVWPLFVWVFVQGMIESLKRGSAR